MPSPVRDTVCRVLSNASCGNALKVLWLEIEKGTFDCQAGQFVMLDLPDPRFLFRRPFSVLATESGKRLALYYKIVGTGTDMMATLQPGDSVRVLGPLGNHFSLPTASDQALMIGGGIGIAPLYMLGKTLPGTSAHACFYGVRAKDELGLYPELQTVYGENLFISTDDGSFGQPGFVTDQLKAQADRVQRATVAYICGPTVMMRATAELLMQMNPAIRIEVSLEEHMPCGTGACTGCVVERMDRPLPSKVCVEGPVFEAAQIRWAHAPQDARLSDHGGVSSCPR